MSSEGRTDREVSWLGVLMLTVAVMSMAIATVYLEGRSSEAYDMGRGFVQLAILVWGLHTFRHVVLYVEPVRDNFEAVWRAVKR